MRTIRSNELILLGLTLAALGLRLWHIDWGLPQRLDLLPDEIDYVMNHAFNLVGRIESAGAGLTPWSIQTLDPVFLNYPSFLMYSIAALWLPIKHLLGTDTPWLAYLVGRVIIATWGALTVPVVYGLARELRATSAGALFAAGATAILPLHIWQSHIAVTDVLMTFWLTATLWAAARLSRTQRWRDFALAGACLGLATGGKYTAAMAVVAIVMGALLGPGTMNRLCRGLTLAAAVSLAACFMVTPYSFINFLNPTTGTLAAMAYEFGHTHSKHYGFTVLDAPGWQYHRWLYQIVAAAPFSLGFALFAASAVGVLWAIRHPNRPRLAVLAFCAFFYYQTGGWEFTPIRYYLPLLIPAVACAGIWVGDWLVSPTGWQRRVAKIAAVLVIGYTTAYAVSTITVYGNETRLQAGRWIDEHVAPGTKIANVGWSRYCGLPAPGYTVVLKGVPQNVVRELRHYAEFDLVQITSLEFARHYRHKEKALMEGYNRLRDPNGTHELAARFESRFLNKSLYEKLDPMFGGYFIGPTIEFYRPKRPADLK